MNDVHTTGHRMRNYGPDEAACENCGAEPGTRQAGTTCPATWAKPKEGTPS